MVRRSLLAATLCAAAAAAVWAVALGTAAGRAADRALFAGFVSLQDTSAAPVAEVVAAVCNPRQYAVLVAALLAYALLARGWRWALAAGLVVLGTNLVTQVLKPALAEERLSRPLLGGEHVIPASWPSGHATAAMALALCAVLVAPAGRRGPAAALGALFAVAVSVSVVLLGWHLPSDAAGGYAVAGAGAALAWAALHPRPREEQRRAGNARSRRPRPQPA